MQTFNLILCLISVALVIGILSVLVHYLKYVNTKGDEVSNNIAKKQLASSCLEMIISIVSLILLYIIKDIIVGLY